MFNYLIFPFRVTGGELFDELVKRGSFSESDAAQIVFSITTGVEVY